MKTSAIQLNRSLDYRKTKTILQTIVVEQDRAIVVADVMVNVQLNTKT